MARERTQYRIVPYREKRKDRRILTPPLAVAVDGIIYETTDWSFGGFRLEGVPGRRRYGEKVSGSLGWKARRFLFVGRVTRRVAATGELAVAFEAIGEDALIFLNAHLRDYLGRGARPRSG